MCRWQGAGFYLLTRSSITLLVFIYEDGLLISCKSTHARLFKMFVVLQINYLYNMQFREYVK